MVFGTYVGVWVVGVQPYVHNVLATAKLCPVALAGHVAACPVHHGVQQCSSTAAVPAVFDTEVHVRRVGGAV
jgi:hypothetical protein